MLLPKLVLLSSQRLEDELEVPTSRTRMFLATRRSMLKKCIASKGVIADLMALRRS